MNIDAGKQLVQQKMLNPLKILMARQSISSNFLRIRFIV